MIDFNDPKQIKIIRNALKMLPQEAKQYLKYKIEELGNIEKIDDELQLQAHKLAIKILKDILNFNS